VLAIAGAASLLVLDGWVMTTVSTTGIDATGHVSFCAMADTPLLSISHWFSMYKCAFHHRHWNGIIDESDKGNILMNLIGEK